jgi:hypothetical protein
LIVRRYAEGVIFLWGLFLFYYRLFFDFYREANMPWPHSERAKEQLEATATQVETLLPYIYLYQLPVCKSTNIFVSNFSAYNKLHENRFSVCVRNAHAQFIAIRATAPNNLQRQSASLNVVDY